MNLILVELSLLLIKEIKNLLPRRVFKRVAQYYKLSKIKLGFPKWVRWLTVIFFIFSTLLGYYPALSFPPVKKAQALAQTQEQKGEVISSSFSKPLILPHPGYLSTKFSSWHPGIDLASGLGMPIHPIIDGQVLETGFDIWGLGNYVIISHENGFVSKYAHMGKVYIKKGDKVSTESILGEVGLTGHTSGPHTHLEVTLHGEYIDPQTILPEIPNMPLTTTR